MPNNHSNSPRSEQCSEEKIAQHLQTIAQLEDRIGDSNSSAEPAFSRAFIALGLCQSHAVTALLSLLAVQRAPKVRYNAVIMLGEIGPEATQAVPQLIEHLQDDDPEIHFLAAKALAKIGQQAVPGLFQALTEKRTQRDVVYALGQISPTTDEILTQLKRLVEDESADMNVRWMAAASLDRNGTDMGDFFLRHQLPAPFEKSLECMMENENWEQPIDESLSDQLQTRKLYIFDIYSQECKLAQTYDLSRFRDSPQEVLEAAQERLRELLGKK
ncbi:MAG: HEAT repeat domain-containing protein [Cyanobacteria bacterium P01_F01_bin.3]